MARETVPDIDTSHQRTHLGDRMKAGWALRYMLIFVRHQDYRGNHQFRMLMLVTGVGL